MCLYFLGAPRVRLRTRTHAWFTALRIRSRSRYHVRTGRSSRCCWGLCAAIGGRPRSQGAEFPAQKSGRSSRRSGYVQNGKYGKIELDPIWTDERKRRTYGNGERYVLRKLRNSYGILTDERKIFLRTYFCNGNGLTARIRNAGNQASLTIVFLIILFRLVGVIIRHWVLHIVRS